MKESEKINSSRHKGVEPFSLLAPERSGRTLQRKKQSYSTPERYEALNGKRATSTHNQYRRSAYDRTLCNFH